MITATHKGKYYGVEYSIVNVSELEGALRLDAEYYDPFYLRNEEKIKKKKWLLLGDEKVSELITDGDHGNPKYCEEGVPYLKVEEIEETGINLNSVKKVCFEYANKQGKKNFVDINDVLITTVGTIGKVCVVTEQIKAILSRDIAKIKLSKTSPISPFYLQAFLMSKNAQILLEQVSTGGLQQGLYIYQIKQLKVSIPSDPFQKFIEQLVLKAYEERQKAEKLYKQAEEILLEELGLKDWKPKTKKIKIGGREFEEEENISIRMLSDVIEADRMDAEYSEPKYGEIINRLKEKTGLKSLGEFLLSEPLKGVEVGSENYQEKGVPFIRVSNISKFGIVCRDQKYLSEKLYLTLKEKFEPKKGEILLTKDATPGVAYVLKEDIKGIIASGIVKLITKNIEKEYLALVINSIIGKMQIVRDGGGAIISHWRPEKIKSLLIPDIDSRIQQKISQLIQQSFTARENSKKLLEIAKRAVEIYIEKNEAEGQKYINEQLQK